ncbi:iron chelate uptake ABC transporter family permease subunit [Micromonospora sp. HUAS LYJ1]|uniref:FecCD family ABC transporter permease n=1 Tax=Micromonospora sp. HUAS LYJ1 TaxID=3061626 RepID=UPI0026717F08|nr:iron chelate uptake ABC transporter family permease subunit [Micromonospora sp. HUAS LYJ1]WKU05796.1 iron chelate uptake ABC transporter family permease subunit [Micromonospora sp. HUAS LYJ1]
MSTTTLEAVTRGRVRRNRRRRAVLAALTLAVAAMVAVSLMVGRTFYPAGDVLRVILGETVPGASFTVGELRLPRTVLALATGLCFGMGGVTFQTMMRNPLASPDIIGISSAASAAAAFAIIVLGLGETGVAVFAIVAALGVAVLIYLLSFTDGVAGTRLVLIGIGIAAMLNSATAYILNQAGQWDLQAATRWLNGSLNGSTWDEAVPVLVALALFGPVLLSRARSLTMLQLGDDTAAALGTRLERTRLVAIVAAVGLIAFATSATGPIAFVAFLAGPIAARLVGAGGSPLLPSALVGALLVLVADFIGQFAFDIRFPVGVITGVLGAPYLIYLLVRTNRAGGSL